MDHLFTLNEYTLKIKCIGRTGVDPSLLFGVDTKLFSVTSDEHDPHHDGHDHDHDHSKHQEADGSQHDEVEVATILADDSIKLGPVLTRDALEQALAKLPKDVVYRVKGYVPLLSSTSGDSVTEGNGIANNTGEPVEMIILNWAFGRFETTPYTPSAAAPSKSTSGLRLTIMGERGEIRRRWAGRLAEALGGKVVL